MDILTFNLGWMSWNTFLAILGMTFGLLIRQPHHKTVKALWAFLWLLFIPNSIYVVTDLYHLTYQIQRIHYTLTPLLVFQYMVLLIAGVITYIIGLFSLEKELQNLNWSKIKIKFFIIAFNFLISFGVTMGRFQRTNSWDIFTNPQRIVSDILGIFFSVEQLFFVLLFAMFCNILYFGFRKNLLFINIYDKDSSNHNRDLKKRKQVPVNSKKRDRVRRKKV